MLRDFITAELKNAFADMLKDAYTPFVLKRSVTTVDVATDTDINQVTAFNGNGVFGNYEAADIDGRNTLVTDIRLYVLAVDINIIPQPEDTVNDLYRVVAVSVDPATVGYTLKLRGYNNGLES